jgi:putative transposase
VATTNGQTYFVTSNTAGRKPFFRHDRWAQLFIQVLGGYRPERFLLHSFVVMPDHFHVLITPQESLEKAVQFIKGGFSFRSKKELGWTGDIWIAGFSDHRIRDGEDFAVHLRYIARNPVEAGLAEREGEFGYCSANGRFELDSFPRGLKPGFVGPASGAAKAAPFQSAGDAVIRRAKAAPFQSAGDAVIRRAKAAPFQSAGDAVIRRAEAAPFQSNSGTESSESGTESTKVAEYAK